jgi:hypothetical protein
MHYTQDYNALSSTSTTGLANGLAASTWTDDSTIPGWYIFRAKNAANAGVFAGTGLQYRVNDGTVIHNTGWVYSMGALNAPNRALGYVPITGDGEYSAIAVFQNTGAVPVNLSNISYKARVRRTNQNAGDVETLAVWWQKAPTKTDLLTLTTAPVNTTEFPPAESTTPTSYYISGWNRVRAAEYTFTTITGDQAVDMTTPVNTAPPAPIRIDPGEFFAIRWGNINDAGADALMGIDDLDLTFTQNDTPTLLVTPVGTVAMDNKGTVDWSDDDFSARYMLSGANTGASTGWHTDETPPRTGSYANLTPATFGPYPVSGGPKTIVVSDNDNPAATATLTISPPARTLTASAPANITHHDNGPGGADDTVSFDLTITGENGGPGWTVDGALPAQGAFGPVTLAVPGGANSVTLQIMDASYPGLPRFVTVPLPGPYLIGEVNTGTGPVPLLTDPATPPAAAWVIDTAARTLTMNFGSNSGGATDKVIASEVFSIAGATGPVTFNANLHIHDLTSGFEDNDTFLAVLIFDGNTQDPKSIVAGYDTDMSGRMNGQELIPRPASPVIQDADHPLTYPIPPGVSTVQLVITGLNDSTNETMRVENIRFTVPIADADGDGISDAYEAANGLNPNDPSDRDLDLDGDGRTNYEEFLAGTAANDPSSVFRLTDVTVNKSNGQVYVMWTTVPGKRYRLQVSPDLVTWTDTGIVVNATGAVSWVMEDAFQVPLAGKGFVRVKVEP